MRPSDTMEQPKILVIQNEFVTEMKLALEYAGRSGEDDEAMRAQMAAIIEAKEIGAAILDTELELGAANSITDVLLDLHIPFVFAGKGSTMEMPGHVMALTMAPALANLTMLGQSILGKPTYH